MASKGAPAISGRRFEADCGICRPVHMRERHAGSLEDLPLAQDAALAAAALGPLAMDRAESAPYRALPRPR